MKFHVVAIKELESQKINLDVLIQGQSQEFVRDFLHFYNLIVLEFTDYEGDVTTFGNVELNLLYQGETINIISNLNNLRIISYNFLMMGFDVKYINFLDYRKMKDEDVMQMIELAKHDVQMEKTLLENNINTQDLTEKEIYHDENLENAIKVAEWQINDINNNIYSLGASISSKDLREIKAMEQELAKLKMGRNKEKIVDSLEKILNKAREIKQNYLLSQKGDQDAIVSGSVITEKDVKYELNNLNKSKNLKTIGRLKSWSDYFYSVMGKFGIQWRFLLRDFGAKLKSFDDVIWGIFGAVNLFVSCVVLIATLYIVWNNVKILGDVNPFVYVVLVQYGLIGLIGYVLSFVKKGTVYRGLFLICIWIITFVIAYGLIRYFFVF